MIMFSYAIADTNINMYVICYYNYNININDLANHKTTKETNESICNM